MHRYFALASVMEKRATRPECLSPGAPRGEILKSDCLRRKSYQRVFGHGFDSRRLHQNTGAPHFGVPLYFSDRMEGIERVRSERQHSALSERTLTERAVRARAIPVGQKFSGVLLPRIFTSSLFTFHSTRARRILKEGAIGKKSDSRRSGSNKPPHFGVPLYFLPKTTTRPPPRDISAGAVRF